MLKRIVRNTLFIFVSQILARVIGVFYLIFLARNFSVANFGIYSFTLTLVYNFVSLADFGLERLILRDVARDGNKRKEYLVSFLPLRILFAFTAFLMLLGAGLILGKSSEQLVYLAIFGLGLLPNSLIFFLTAFENAKEKMGATAWSNIFVAILVAIIGVLAIKLRFALWVLFLAYPLANLFVFFGLLIFLQKQGLFFSWKINTEIWKKGVSQSWVFAFFGILAVFYLRSSVLMTNYFLGAEATGWYSSVFKFVEALILLPQGLALALFPLSSKLMAESREKLTKVYWRSFGLLFLMAIPFVLVMLILPVFLVRFTYGQRYLPAVPSMQVLAISLFFFFPNALVGNVVQNSEKVKQYLPLIIGIFVWTLVLGILLIPRMGIVGAAWTVVGGEFVGFLVSIFFVNKILKTK